MIFFVFACFACVSYGKILAAVVVSKHGARAPAVYFDWDKAEWGVSPGELTVLGQLQHSILGTKIRERYIVDNKITAEKYNISEVDARSTSFQRTIMSAYSQLQSLFPEGPKIRQEMRAKAVPPLAIKNLDSILASLNGFALPFHYQAVPVKMADREKDYVLLGFDIKVCPKMLELKEDIKKNGGFLKYKQEFNKNLKPSLERALNSNVEFEKLILVADALISLKTHGYSVPSEITDKMYEQIISFSKYCLFYRINDLSVRLGTSEFFMTVLKDFQDVATGKSSKKLSLYLGHDITIVGILIALQNWDYEIPDFASSLVFELHEEFGEIFVEVLYNDKKIVLPFCSEKCWFTEYEAFMDNFIYEDIKKECMAEYNKEFLELDEKEYDEFIS